MGLFDSRKKKKSAPAEEDPLIVKEDPDRHHVEALDYLEEEKEEETVRCPECAREQRHVVLVKTEGEQLECPECHYLQRARRI